jgi:ribosomal subunit interface protein
MGVFYELKLEFRRFAMPSFPLNISYTDFSPSESLNALIEERATRLERYFDRISQCQVVVSSPHRHHRQKIYHITIKLHVPGAELVVNREPEKDLDHQDIRRAVRDAFTAMTRQLEDFAGRKRAKRGA